MAIVGGFDMHRRQVTFDYAGTGTGQVRRGRISPACRETLRVWLERFAGRDDVTFAVEGCTGWRFITGELARAGITVLLAEPAETAHLRGPKRRAKTDKTDARHLRILVAEGRVPLSWIPPEQVTEMRAVLELYRDLREEHTAWTQRIHATLFHHGVPGLAGRLSDPRAAPGSRTAAPGWAYHRPARRRSRSRCAGWRTWRPSSRPCTRRSRRSPAASPAARPCNSSCPGSGRWSPR